jgi:hypothetical protein
MSDAAEFNHQISTEKSRRSERITSFEDHPAALALERFQENPRVDSIRLIPELPLLHCSHPLGCRSFYEPRLSEIFP